MRVRLFFSALALTLLLLLPYISHGTFPQVTFPVFAVYRNLSLIHISEPTRRS